MSDIAVVLIIAILAGVIVFAISRINASPAPAAHQLGICECDRCVSLYGVYFRNYVRHGYVDLVPPCNHDNCMPRDHDFDDRYLLKADFNRDDFVLKSTYDRHTHTQYVTRDELRRHDGVLGRVLNVLRGILFGAVAGFFLGLILNWTLPRAASEFKGVITVLFGNETITENVVLYNHLAKYGFVLGCMVTCAFIGGLIMLAVGHFRARRDARQQTSDQGA